MTQHHRELFTNYLIQLHKVRQYLAENTTTYSWFTIYDVSGF